MGDPYNPAPPVNDQVAFHREFEKYHTIEPQPAGTPNQVKPKLHTIDHQAVSGVMPASIALTTSTAVATATVLNDGLHTISATAALSTLAPSGADECLIGFRVGSGIEVVSDYVNGRLNWGNASITMPILAGTIITWFVYPTRATMVGSHISVFDGKISRVAEGLT